MAIRYHTRKPSILFLANGNKALGLGHLARCRSIAKAFILKADFDIFLSSAQRDMAQRLFSDLESIEILESREVFTRRRYDVVVADIPRMSLSCQIKCKKKSNAFVYINDDEMGPFFADVVIRPNVLDLPEPSFLTADGVCWHGSKYIILDPVYLKVKKWSGTGKNAGRNIFLCFGGSDPHNITATTVSLLKSMSTNFQVNAVVGAAYRHLRNLTHLIGDDNRFRLHVNVPNVARLLTKAGFAIISGGTLLYEACSLGVPSIVVNQNIEQNREAAYFQKANAIINFGIFSGNKMNGLEAPVKNMMRSQKLRLQLAGNCRRCLPSFGTFNIVNAIRKNYIDREDKKGVLSEKN
jgi:UDP-2,4-diacetamido-2,4,6-trideoxy-beta-L-altropyranose hydrolase